MQNLIKVYLYIRTYTAVQVLTAVVFCVEFFCKPSQDSNKEPSFSKIITF